MVIGYSERVRFRAAAAGRRPALRIPKGIPSARLADERRANRLHRLLAFGQINDGGNFYFAGGDHVNVHN